MNNRRILLIALGAGTFSPRALFAQAKQKPVLIGWLSLGSERSIALPAFKQALIALGWKEEMQFTLEARWANGQIERLRPLAEELAAKRPAVIVAPGTRAAQAATKVAPGIPIVVLTSADPVATGLAASLARPGGMVTGVTTLVAETSAKHLELLLDCVPKIRRVGILIDPSGANSALRRKVLQRSAAQRSVDARFAEAAKRADIEPALSRLARENIEALILVSSDVFTFQSVRLSSSSHWRSAGRRLHLPSATSKRTYCLAMAEIQRSFIVGVLPTWTGFSRVQSRGICPSSSRPRSN